MTAPNQPTRRTREDVTVSELIDNAVDRVENRGYTLHELAEKCHLVRPNSKALSPVISMLRNGTMRIPVDKIPFVAEGLNIDMNDLIYAFFRESVEHASMRQGATDGPKNFERSWTKMSKVFDTKHNKREEALLIVFREMEKEIGYDLQIDEDFAEKFRELIRHYYAL